MIGKNYSVHSSDHDLSPLPPIGPQHPGCQAEESGFPSFKVLAQAQVSSPFIRWDARQAESPPTYRDPQTHQHPPQTWDHGWGRRELAACPAYPISAAISPNKAASGGHRVTLESNPRISVLISAGITSLSWISKDSVTNEKHTSSWNEVNFLKKRGGAFSLALLIYIRTTLSKGKKKKPFCFWTEIRESYTWEDAGGWCPGPSYLSGLGGSFLVLVLVFQGARDLQVPFKAGEEKGGRVESVWSGQKWMQMELGFFFLIYLIYLFIFGCVGSLLLRTGFL